jgi:hypothetical protein
MPQSATAKRSKHTQPQTAEKKRTNRLKLGPTHSQLAAPLGTPRVWVEAAGCPPWDPEGMGRGSWLPPLGPRGCGSRQLAAPFGTPRVWVEAAGCPPWDPKGMGRGSWLPPSDPEGMGRGSWLPTLGP